LWKEKENAMS
jgi:hypothetical protein